MRGFRLVERPWQPEPVVWRGRLSAGQQAFARLLSAGVERRWGDAAVVVVESGEPNRNRAPLVRTDGRIRNQTVTRRVEGAGIRTRRFSEPPNVVAVVELGVGLCGRILGEEGRTGRGNSE